jgi:hypothetical protein
MFEPVMHILNARHPFYSDRGAAAILSFGFLEQAKVTSVFVVWCTLIAVVEL